MDNPLANNNVTGGSSTLDNNTLLSNTNQDNTPLPTTTPNGMKESPQQQQQQQQNQNQQQQQQQQKSYSSPSSQSKFTDHGESTSLADLEEEFADMNSLLSDKVTLQSMSNEFKKRYLTKLNQIEERRAEMKDHLNYLIEKKRLKQNEAEVFLNAIECNDDKALHLKRPLYGAIECSLDGHKEQEQINLHKFKLIEESNKRFALERDEALKELEAVKKKVKTNDFAGFGGSSNNNSNVLYQQQQPQYQSQYRSSNPIHNEISRNINLLDFMQKSTDPNVKREVIGMHIASQYDHDTANSLVTDERGKNNYDRLYAAVVTRYS